MGRKIKKKKQKQQQNSKKPTFVEIECPTCNGTKKEPLDMGDNMQWSHSARSSDKPCSACKGKKKIKVPAE